MNSLLLILALIIILCTLLNKISFKLGVPVLLVFIFLGMLFGSDGIVRIEFEDYKLVENVCSLALVFIMFYGGFGTKWRAAKPVATKAVLLSTFGVVLTALFTGTFCCLVLHFPLLEGMLIGSVISSTDAASVFSILRSKRLNLKYNTASLLELESGSNDPCSYMLTIIVLSIMKGESQGCGIIISILKQFGFGLFFGVGIAVLALYVLKKLHFAKDGFDTAFVLAIAILAYALPSYLGGNGYLSAYLVGIIMGNRPLSNKKNLVHFFDGITGLMQMVIFFLLGLTSFPSKLPNVMLLSFVIAAFITLVARPLASIIILKPFHSKWNQIALVCVSGFRGAASIVFAIMVINSNLKMDVDIFHLVFGIVLFSIAIQGSLIPFCAKKLKMIDSESDVLKTFSDYPDEISVQFIKLTVSQNHPWVGKAIRELVLPPETLLVVFFRKGKKIIPHGNTVIHEDDVLVLGAQVFAEESSLHTEESLSLVEKTIDISSDLCGKSIQEINTEKNELIVLIKRNKSIIIPTGKTILQKDDVLVIESE